MKFKIFSDPSLASPRMAMHEWIRFWSNVEKTAACWNWIGSVWKNKTLPYGRFWHREITWSAARFIYSVVHGKIPEGLTIDHLCKNSLCVNPNHLEAVTMKENILRGNGLAALNSRKNACPKGHSYEGNLVIYAGARNCLICKREISNRATANMHKRRTRLGMCIHHAQRKAVLGRKVCKECLHRERIRGQDRRRRTHES